MEVLFFKVQLHYKGKTFLYRKCLSGFNLMKDQNIRKEKRDLDKPSNICSSLNMPRNTDFNLWMQILINFVTRLFQLHSSSWLQYPISIVKEMLQYSYCNRWLLRSNARCRGHFHESVCESFGDLHLINRYGSCERGDP